MLRKIKIKYKVNCIKELCGRNSPHLASVNSAYKM